MQDDGSTQRQGSLSGLAPGREVDYVLQRHDAKRSGLHADLRLGDPDMGLASWAVPKAELPAKPGESRLALREPLHRHDHGSFEGEIPSGRGAGTVEMADRGRNLLLGVGPLVPVQ